jgi:riboflavin-specific deaminase-like protein
MRQLFPRDDAPDAEPYADLRFPERADRPWVAVNMVTTVDGAAAIDGSARGIGSRTDRRVMRLVRAAADALLVGAGTLRADRVDPRVPDDLAARRAARGLPPQPLAVALSGRLDLDPGHPFFRHGPEGALVLTSEAAPAARARAFDGRATVVRLGRAAVDLPAALGYLRAERGVRALLVEGGPRVNGALLAAGLLDEVFWTVAPALAGGSGLAMLRTGGLPERIEARLDLLSLWEHEGELFARYRVVRPDHDAVAAAEPASREGRIGPGDGDGAGRDCARR